MFSLLRRLWRLFLRAIGVAVPTLSLQKKWIDGYFLDENEEGIEGATVTADLSDRVVRNQDRAITEIDGHIESTTDTDGYWSMPLHPNNDTADAPTDTLWTITEPGGHTEQISIDKDDAHGDTAGDAIAYTSLITAPSSGPPPNDWQAQLNSLATTVTGLSNVIDLMLTEDSDALAALTPARATDLVDDAIAASANATTSVAGLMSSADKTKLDSITVANLMLLDASGGILPSLARPTSLASGQARIYRNQTTGEIEVAANIGGTFSYSVLAPGFDSPAFQITTDFSVTSTTPATVNAGAPLNVAANALYFISGPIAYTAQGQYDIGIRFSAIPGGSTLRWGAVGLSGLAADANFAARPTTTPPASGGVGYIDSALRTGTNEMLLPGQGITNSLLTGQAQSPPGAVSVWLYGTLRTGTNIGGLNFQARQNVITSGGTTNPLILAGTSVTLTRVA